MGEVYRLPKGIGAREAQGPPQQEQAGRGAAVEGACDERGGVGRAQNSSERPAWPGEGHGQRCRWQGAWLVHQRWVRRIRELVAGAARVGRRTRAVWRRHLVYRRLLATLRPLGLGTEALNWLPQLGRIAGVWIDDGLVLDVAQRRLQEVWTPALGQAGQRLEQAARQLFRASVQALPIGPENAVLGHEEDGQEGRFEPGSQREFERTGATASVCGHWARLGVWIAPQVERVYCTHHLWTPAGEPRRTYYVSILRGAWPVVSPYCAWTWDEAGRVCPLDDLRTRVWQTQWDRWIGEGLLPVALAIRPWWQPPVHWVETRRMAGAALTALAAFTNPLASQVAAGVAHLRSLGLRVIWQSQLGSGVARAVAAAMPGLEVDGEWHSSNAFPAGASIPEPPVWVRLQRLPDGSVLLRWWGAGELGSTHVPVVWQPGRGVHPLLELGKLCRLGKAFN
ncbi:MAG: hypothetical protein IMX01_05145 [Limnochordaceae bacterium]|nr:hypothetical protein [Limnochordaceae bacterium]